jgi:hypothetical protein
VDLTEDRRKELIAKLPTASDTKLAEEFGVSRKTIWRLRQGQKQKSQSQTRMAAVQIPEVAPTPVPEPEPERFEPPTLTVVPKLDTAEPKPEVERPKKVEAPVHLNTYFAVQLLRGESPKLAAGAVLTCAHSKGVLFRKLQVLDITLVGARPFVRFRSDMPTAYDVIRTMTGRAIIAEVGGAYMVQFEDGRSGKYPASSMCSPPKVGFGQVYAGTKIKRWKEQFAA